MEPVERVANDYAAALDDYLAEPNETTLARAYEVGREALVGGIGVLDMTTLHSRALSAALSRVLPEQAERRILQAQADFFVEALSPFEMAHRAFRESNSVLRRLNDALEAQATRIAYALHDEVGQLLASIHFSIGEAVSQLSAEEAKSLAPVKGLLNDIEEGLRTIAHELRPPVLEEIGLHRALELAGESVSKRFGLPVSVETALPADMHPVIETAVYRIAQEALTNAAKHARANQAEVNVHHTPLKVVCSIRDDGIGFGEASADRKRPGLGIASMRERVSALGGELHIRANGNRGTDLTIEIPLED